MSVKDNEETQYIPRHDDDDRTFFYDLGETQPIPRTYDFMDDTQTIPREELLRGRRRRWLKQMRWPLSRIGTFALVFVIIGVSLWCFAFIKMFGHQGAVNREQNALIQEWDNTTAPQPTGTKRPTPTPTKVKPTRSAPSGPLLSASNSVAKVTVPRLGMTWIVVEGVAESDIVYAPGHYPNSALPGQSGNFAIAGHREPGIFWDLDKLQIGDIITVENKAHKIFTYKVTRNFITKPQSWPEVSQTPPGFAQGSKVLTFTTCNPKWDNYERLVVHAVMI